MPMEVVFEMPKGHMCNTTLSRTLIKCFNTGFQKTHTRRGRCSEEGKGYRYHTDPSACPHHVRL